MSTVSEALGAPTPMGSDLQAGVETLDLEQSVTFTRYVRVVLPIDGFVYWVAAAALSPSALYNAALLNRAAYDAAPKVAAVAPTLTAKGSLHYATETRQEEQNTFAVNSVVFTSEQEVTELNAIAPNEMWLATFQGVRFAFSSRASFYVQADLWHYRGHAVYSDMDAVIVDQPAALNRKQVVSNSLPAWLALQSYAGASGFGGPSFPLFPSFAVPDNLAPPFGTVHIGADDTRAIGAALLVAPDSSLTQLASDRVRITLFGVRNDEALDFVQGVNQYSLDTDAIGVMNMPVVRDDKRPQPELMALSIKKIIDFEVSYYQRRMNDVARQLILEAVPTFYVTDGP